MIHPITSEHSFRKTPVHKKCFTPMTVYYIVLLVVNLVNFVPGVYSRYSLKLQNQPISNKPLYWMSASAILSVPLIFEFILDTIVSVFYPVYHHNILEHRFGHSMLLLSLALPAIAVFAAPYQPEVDLLFASCLVNCCQALAIFAIYGKLQVFGQGDWNFFNSMGVVLLYLAAQLAINFGIGKCGNNPTCYIPSLNSTISILFLVVCLVLHVWFSRRFLYDLYAIFMKKKHEAISFSSNQYTCLVLILILCGYLISKILLAIGNLRNSHSLQEVLTVHIAVHLALALCAAVLPGRMIRRGMVALKVSNMFISSDFTCSF